MSDNPYAPPTAQSKPSDIPPRRGSAPLAVLIGWATDIGGTTVFAALALVVIGILMGGGGATDVELMAFERSSGWQMFGLIFGMGFTSLGGYVTARIANHSEYKLAAITGLISLVTGEILMQAGEVDSSMFWVRLVGFIFTLPAALGGAWWYLQRKR
jgi:hypothetical protein